MHGGESRAFGSMRNFNGKEYAAAIGKPAYRHACARIADIVARMNAIGEDPLRRREAVALRRAYTAAVVRYFDHRRMVRR